MREEIRREKKLTKLENAGFIEMQYHRRHEVEVFY
jgi:hypothetical protein